MIVDVAYFVVHIGCIFKKYCYKKRRGGDGMNLNNEIMAEMPTIGGWHVPRILRQSNSVYYFLVYIPKKEVIESIIFH